MNHGSMRKRLALLLQCHILVLASSVELPESSLPSIGKRFSMNYMDLVKPSNPDSWQNTIHKLRSTNQKREAYAPDGVLDLMTRLYSDKGLAVNEPLLGGQEGLAFGKRFSMNYLDTIPASDPRSWLNTVSKSRSKTKKSDATRQAEDTGNSVPVKRFSMNYLDTIPASDPRSWLNTVSKSQSKTKKSEATRLAEDAGNSMPVKRFSMNFRDTIGTNDPRSWKNTITILPLNSRRSLTPNSHGGKEYQELHKKRSRTYQESKAAWQKSAHRILATINELLAEVLKTLGEDGICRNPIMFNLLKIQDELSQATASDGSFLVTKYIDC